MIQQSDVNPAKVEALKEVARLGLIEKGNFQRRTETV
jgi:hypothetical protein